MILDAKLKKLGGSIAPGVRDVINRDMRCDVSPIATSFAVLLTYLRMVSRRKICSYPIRIWSLTP
jgi:hypothetical protein